MFNHILKHYLSRPRDVMPFEADVMSTDKDMRAVLLLIQGQWYVLLETEYSTLDTYLIDEVTDMIEVSFPVIVRGWCVRLECRKEVESDILPLGWFESSKEITLNPETTIVIYEEDSLRYALFQVKLQKGFSAKSLSPSF